MALQDSPPRLVQERPGRGFAQALDDGVQGLGQAAGTTIYAIGLGEPGDVLSSLLASLASDPSMFYITPDAEDLAAIYRRILVHIACQ